MNKMWPFFSGRHSHDLYNLLHLISLKWNGLFGVHLCLFPFEDGSEREQFGEDAADGPHVDGGGVVSRSEEEFGRSVPDCYDDFVAAEEGVEGFIEEACKAEIAYPNLAAGCNHDICGFQIPM